MSPRGIVNSLVAVIAILIVGGAAAVAVIDGPPTSEESKTVSAGISRDSFAIEAPQTTADTRPRANTQPLPTTMTPAPEAPVIPVITVPVPPPTTVPPVTIAPIPPPPVMPILNWPPAPPPLPPVVIQTGPASWKFEDKGVTVTASVSPSAPRVGDTVTISFTTGGVGDACCRGFVFVGGAMIGTSLPAEGETCQPTAMTSGTASVVVSEPGPFTFNVQAVQEGCVSIHQFTTVGLSATVQVLPA